MLIILFDILYNIKQIAPEVNLPLNSTLAQCSDQSGA